MAWWLLIFSLVLSLLACVVPCVREKILVMCKRDSYEINQCIVNAWEALRPKMGEGIPKLGIPTSFRDLLATENEYIDRRSDSLDLKATMTQLAIMEVNSVVFSKLE